MRWLVLFLACLLSGCHADRLRSVDNGFEIRSRATAAQVQDAARDVARELDHPVRERDGRIEIELARAPPMSEIPSRWLWVTVETRGGGTRTTARLLPEISVRQPVSGATRPTVGSDVYTYADRLADRLAEIR